MPFLALVAHRAHANSLISNPQTTDTQQNEFIVDMQGIGNPLHSTQFAASGVRQSVEHFQKAVFECRPVPVNTYFDNVLAELVTPTAACADRRYASNAQLRGALSEVLALHPQADELSLNARIKALGLPSLLRDEANYLPGSLTALCHDIGAHAVKIGRIDFPDVEVPGEAEFLFAGESELAFLHEHTPHAPRIREDHASILDFHYRAAGMTGHTSLPPAGYVNAAHDNTHLADFTAHLARCRQRTDLARSDRASESRTRYFSPPDAMQTGPFCTLL